MELFIFDWWPIADLPMAMVEPVDVFGHSDLELVDVRPWGFVGDEFGLEQRVERLRQGIVIRIALGPDGGHHVGFGQAFGKVDSALLHSSVGVKPNSA